MVLPDVLAGHDVLAQSPTGSGETLAFGTPMIEGLHGTNVRPSALVLAPTRELAIQIVDDLREIAHVRALSIAAVYGGAGMRQAGARSPRRADVLVATPGRLVDLLDRRDSSSLGKVEMLVLDEADRMLDMGFRPVVDKLIALTPGTRQTLLFSATLEGETGRLARGRPPSHPRRHEHRHSAEAQGTVEHRFVRVKPERRATERLAGESSTSPAAGARSCSYAPSAALTV